EYLLWGGEGVWGRVARGQGTRGCRVQAYKLPTNAGRAAVSTSLMIITENCDRHTGSPLIRAISIKRSPITISDRCGPGRVLSATSPYTSARAKPHRRSKHRRRSSRSDSRWRSGVANCPPTQNNESLAERVAPDVASTGDVNSIRLETRGERI